MPHLDPVRLVMDTDAIVAAMRSRGGASAGLLLAARSGRATLLATAPLFVEYEAVCGRAEHRRAAGFDADDLRVFLDALADLVEPVHPWFRWRPQLPDPGDELVLEAALNGRADAIVTFNRRHFARAADRFGVEVLLPAEALRRVT
jgi:predicted nucleic acid-binding protein